MRRVVPSTPSVARWMLFQFSDGRLIQDFLQYTYWDHEMNVVRQRSDCILDLPSLIVCFVDQVDPEGYEVKVLQLFVRL